MKQRKKLNKKAILSEYEQVASTLYDSSKPAALCMFLRRKGVVRIFRKYLREEGIIHNPSLVTVATEHFHSLIYEWHTFLGASACLRYMILEDFVDKYNKGDI